MKRFKEWWEQDKRYMTLVKAVLLALLPVLCCMVRCAMDGKSIGQVWLPNCEWNDELFYFKQVESIVNFGYPQGYFGFNESIALKLSFAAWSPVLVFPWILWGAVFGWNLMSPILCNIALLSFVFFLFVWLVKPTWKQLGITALLLCFYTPMWRYTLSVMPETICMAMGILFYGVAIDYTRRQKNGTLIALFLLSAVMTLMRPYLVLFMLLPAYFCIRKGKWKGAVASAACILITFGIYVLINHYLGAKYFAPLFFTDWIEAFFNEGILRGIVVTCGKLYRMGKMFLAYTVEGFRSGLYAGTYFGAFVVMSVIYVIQCIADFRSLRRKGQEAEEKKGSLAIEVHILLCFVAMFFALLLMYKLTEGSRHLLTFMAAGIFGIGLMDTMFYKKAVLMAVTFAYLLGYKAVDPIVYQIPYATEEAKVRLEHWEKIFEDEMVLQGETPNFDNVIIWVTNDTLENGESRNVNWQMLYGIPKGFGISCCQPDYCKADPQSLSSKYLATLPGGELDRMLSGAYEEVERDEQLVVYRLHE